MGEHFDLLLSGGVLFSGNGLFRSDVAIRGGKIVEINSGITFWSVREALDVSGKRILPGIIDVHTHPLYEDDFETTSLTAAWGGTTTLIHYV